MNTADFMALARRLMSCPAVPYQESGVAREILRIGREHDLKVSRDRFGNLIVTHVRGDSRQRPLVLAAHMDHPGFELLAEAGVGGGQRVARFLGGVGPSYFKRGVRLRLHPGNYPARLGRRQGKKSPPLFQVQAMDPGIPKSGPEPTMAVWDLPDVIRKKDRLHGRACDDLIGVAAVLAALIEFKASRRMGRLIGVLCRAEEVGFQGALALADSGRLPRRALVISLETSKEMPPVRMGDGVIIRIGDRSSIFDSRATRFLTEVAAGLSGREDGFRFQRAWMSGGTCEGTAYQDFGYQTAAVCVALGNYHNCGADQKIAEEYVSLRDACRMVTLLVEAAGQMKRFDQLTGKLSTRLKGFLDEGKRRLVRGE